jgi:hypothetical protein
LVDTLKLLDDQAVPVHYSWVDSWWCVTNGIYANTIFGSAHTVRCPRGQRCPRCSALPPFYWQTSPPNRYGERLHKGVALWEDITSKPPDFSDMNQRFPTGLTGMTEKTGRKVAAPPPPHCSSPPSPPPLPVHPSHPLLSAYTPPPALLSAYTPLTSASPLTPPSPPPLPLHPPHLRLSAYTPLTSASPLTPPSPSRWLRTLANGVLRRRTLRMRLTDSWTEVAIPYRPKKASGRSSCTRWVRVRGRGQGARVTRDEGY